MAVRDTHPTRTGAPARRAELVAAAVRVIARRGYAETRFQDVAEEAGVAVGTLQHHFGTRRRMLMEALQTWLEETDAQAAVLRDREGTAWQRLQALLGHLGTGLGERSDAWRMWLDFLGAALRDAELRGSTRQSSARWVTAIADVVQEGIDAGEFAPQLSAEEVADVIAALVDGIALQLFALGADTSGSEINERLLRVARALLRPIDA